jgi:hypothetical protein
MSVKYINRSHGLSIIPLNSGDSIHLAPGETSPAIDEIEIKNNAKVQKLLRANLIAPVGPSEAAGAGGGKDLKKKKGT